MGKFQFTVVLIMSASLFILILIYYNSTATRELSILKSGVFLLGRLDVRDILIPPWPEDLPYNLTHPNKKDPSMGQTKLILRALNYKRNGFFVECGAWDGETRSNTLLLERDFGWSGLLIEADPSNFRELTFKKRKAWRANVCLSTKKFPHPVLFHPMRGRGRISRYNGNDSVPPGLLQVQCYPLTLLLDSLNRTSTGIDYLSLDVEGDELKILRTIPRKYFNRIGSISVEYIHSPGGKTAIWKWLSSRRFSLFGQVKDPNNLANDLIFINNKNMKKFKKRVQNSINVSQTLD